ncbi:MAG: CYTH domain-containing protein [Vibrionaceae bacterium]
METEIELKFFVSTHIGEKMAHILSHYHIQQHNEWQIFNTYYDTPQLTLRQNDIGFRVRKIGQDHYQTVKSAGKVSAGLHQRDEFETKIESDQPDFAQLPASMFPQDVDLNALCQSLQPLFTTDFKRQQWLLELKDGSLVELAFDVGEVRVPNSTTHPICEIEIELKKGEISAVFELARAFAAHGNIRLSNLSKAALGYQMASGFLLSHESTLFTALDKSSTAEQSFIKMMEQALSYWLYHEQSYIESKELGCLVALSHAVRALLCTLQIFETAILLPTNHELYQELQWLDSSLLWVHDAKLLNRLTQDKGYFLRTLNAQKLLLSHLSQAQEQLPTYEAINAQLHSPRYCLLLLRLNEWLVSQQWRQTAEPASINALEQPLPRFANEQLSLIWLQWQALALTDLIDHKDYLVLQHSLARFLHTNLAFASLFEEGKSEHFSRSWQDLLLGIDKLRELELIEPQLHLIDNEEEASQAQKWLQRKQNALFNAMQQSLQASDELSIYWQMQQ